jgi:Fic family protein
MSSKKKIGETTYKETSFGIIPRSKLIPLEIEGIKRAWDFVLQNKNHASIPLTIPFFKKVHAIGFGWIFPEFGGKFRIDEVTVSNHIPPKYFLVPQLMEDFVRDLKFRLKCIPKIDDLSFFEEFTGLLAWAHQRFLWIHPFHDYNGRIARLLINMILLKFNFPPVELKVETLSTRKKYIRALQKADSGEYSELQKLIREAMEESIKEFQL